MLSSIRTAARRLSSRPRETVITRADRAVRSGQFELALRLYGEALDRDPANPPIWVQRGHLLKHSGKLDAAEDAYRRAIALAPSVADYHLQLGHVLKLKSRREEAEAAYLRGLTLDPSSEDAARELLALGWSQERLGQLRKATATDIPQAGSGKPRRLDTGASTSRFWLLSKPSDITLADRARDAGDWDRAARLYLKVLRRNPQNVAIRVQYGHVLKSLGRLEAAEAAYREAVACDPGNADTQLQLGHVLKLRDDPKAAASAYLRAFAADPSLREPLDELAGVGWSERALAELRRAASARPVGE
jgi:tetratricopeptide (TPR) repeat protein